MVVSIRMSDEEKKLASAYAKLSGRTLGDAIKRAFFEQIEYEYDVALGDAAYEEYLKDPKTYTLDEIKKELGI